MNKHAVGFLTKAGIIAAFYAALTYLCALWGLAYLKMQFRISEALTILPIFTPAAIPGLTLGCFLGNLGSPFGIMDAILGTLATFLAAILTRLTRQVRFKDVPWLSPVFPVLTNAVIIGLEISFFLPEGLTFAGFLTAAVSVAIPELIICYLLGLPLTIFIDRTPALKHRLSEDAVSEKTAPKSE